MTMHVVLGNGTMTTKQLTKELVDLWDQADKEDDGDYWFTVEAKEDPTSTDVALMDWLRKKDIYWEVLLPTGVKYNSVVYHKDGLKIHPAGDSVKAMAKAAVKCLKEIPNASVLALFVDPNDPDCEADTMVNGVLELIHKDGFDIYGMNDAMAKMDFVSEDEAPEAPEAPVEYVGGDTYGERVGAVQGLVQHEHPTPAPTKPERKEEPVPEDEDTGPLTRVVLEHLTLKELQAIAKGMGLPSTNKTKPVLVDLILGEDALPDEQVAVMVEEAEEVAVETEAPKTGHTPWEDIRQQRDQEVVKEMETPLVVPVGLKGVLYAVEYFYHQDLRNSALHMSDVRFSPITFELARPLYDLVQGNAAVNSIRRHDGQYELDRGR